MSITLTIHFKEPFKPLQNATTIKQEFDTDNVDALVRAIVDNGILHHTNQIYYYIPSKCIECISYDESAY